MVNEQDKDRAKYVHLREAKPLEGDGTLLRRPSRSFIRRWFGTAPGRQLGREGHCCIFSRANVLNLIVQLMFSRGACPQGPYPRKGRRSAPHFPLAHLAGYFNSLGNLSPLSFDSYRCSPQTGRTHSLLPLPKLATVVYPT